MKKTCLPIALSILIGTVAAPTAVAANDFVGNWMDSLYVSTFLAGHFLPDVVTDTLTNDVAYSNETYRQETGFAARFAAGGRINGHLRAEVEFGFNRSSQGSIDEILVGATTTTTYAGHGDIDTYTLMGNLWVDIPLFGGSWALTPYVGGGVGAALVQSDLIYTSFPGYGPQDSSVELAAQLGAGLNWAISDRFSAGFGYRLLFVNGPDISQTTGVNEVTTYRFDDMLSHSVGVTLTAHLN